MKARGFSLLGGYRSAVDVWAAALFCAPLWYSLWKIPRCLRTEQSKEILDELSVIIPARNEERTIGELLDSLRDQPWGAAEIIVVNDRSSDRTAEIAAKKGARVLTFPEPPPGWTGKTWACMRGARNSSGNYLLFLDADVRLEPGALVTIAAEYYHHRGALSILPFSILEKPYQQCALFFNILTAAGTDGFSLFHRRPGGLFGPCLLCRRDDYFRIGGHEPVKGSLVENLSLGKSFRRAGIPLRLYGGKGTLGVRVYPGGPGEMMKGWARSFASGAMSGSRKALLLMTIWISGAFLSLLMFTRKQTARRAAGAALYGLYAGQVYWAARRLGTYKLSTAVLFPLPLFFCVGIFLYSIVRAPFKRISWKGRPV